MKTTEVYSKKAENYARYRWDYSPAAVDWLCQTTGVNLGAVAADLGAGTGKLTRQLVGRVGTIYALEPNPEMRRYLEAALADCPTCRVLANRAEQTGLEPHSLDLITAAQAIHWLDPQPARDEMRRILKPGGWIAFLRNQHKHPALSAALEPITGAAVLLTGQVVQNRPPQGELIDYYFADTSFEKQAFEFVIQENWEAFWGGLTSAAFMPEDDHPQFPALKQAARQVFEQFNIDGLLTIHAVTEVTLGRQN
ncbi:MAG TPA: class I SAM-dependent methyltransferase [Anaerolineales bacterium]|nr:class I SAM-dependent methyltransferase [Anaerolineales bacterium]